MVANSKAARMQSAQRAASILYRMGAQRVWLFGSLSRISSPDNASDADLAVEGISSKRLELITDQLRAGLRMRLDVVSLDDASPQLRHGIMATRILMPRTPSQSRLLATTTEETEVAPITVAASLHEERVAAVLAALKAKRVHRLLDFGCGAGILLKEAANDESFKRLVGVDLSTDMLELAQRRLADVMRLSKPGRIELIHGLITNPDPRFAGFDGAAAIEVIEHLDPPRLQAFVNVVFSFIRPMTVVVTTPNVEYNAVWFRMLKARRRHDDHRFEWTRTQFQAWASQVAVEKGYHVAFNGVGPVAPQAGMPTQMAVFSRLD